MTLLPSQKLTIGEFLVSLAAGLMLYLLPNDAKNQFESESVCIGFVFVTSIVITAVMSFIIKRYEALGTALMTFSSLCIINLAISVISGIITKGAKYWPKLTEYNIICMFILWVVPFLFGITMRLLTGQAADTNDSRRKFIRFMSLSMNSLLMIYGIVLILRMIIPTAPNMQGERIISVEPLAYVKECLQGSEKGTLLVLIWNSIILAPLTFYLSVLIPHFKIIHGIILGLILGVALEGLQFLFNTEAVHLDDVILYIIGAMLGIGIKYAINGLRYLLSQGRDPCMLTLEYIPIPKKNRGEAQVIED